MIGVGDGGDDDGTILLYPSYYSPSNHPRAFSYLLLAYKVSINIYTILPPPANTTTQLTDPRESSMNTA
jgi:hypothetical protein